MAKAYYSNCLLEAIKAKLKHRNQTKILRVKSKDGLHHFVWYDLVSDNVYDFQQLEAVKHWHNLLWFKGKIRTRSRKAFERWKAGEQNG